MNANVGYKSLMIGMMVMAFFLMPVMGEECVTDAYGNMMCGVGHYMGLEFDGNATSIMITGEDIALVDEGNNVYGVDAPMIGIVGNLEEHSFAVKTWEKESWTNFLCTSFEGGAAGPITITGKNLTIIEIGMDMPETFQYAINFDEHVAYIDL